MNEACQVINGCDAQVTIYFLQHYDGDFFAGNVTECMTLNMHSQLFINFDFRGNMRAQAFTFQNHPALSRCRPHHSDVQHRYVSISQR